MCGSIRFISVPAEELIELAYRESLRKKGIIRYFGGKTEFIARGYFDGVDMAMMIHSGKLPEGQTLSIGKGSNGCLTKNIIYKGVSSHAGGSPDKGKNALYAATCGLNAVNALRETFLDNEHIRFHPIITQAGMAVNAIPETAVIESYVRGASFDSIYEYNKKVNRALAGAAACIGCNVELDDHPGYFPLNNDENLTAIFAEAMEAVSGPGSVAVNDHWGCGSTDMGDVSAIMPAIHPHASGTIRIPATAAITISLIKNWHASYRLSAWLSRQISFCATMLPPPKKSSQKRIPALAPRRNSLPLLISYAWIRMLSFIMKMEVSRWITANKVCV